MLSYPTFQTNLDRRYIYLEIYKKIFFELFLRNLKYIVYLEMYKRPKMYIFYGKKSMSMNNNR